MSAFVEALEKVCRKVASRMELVIGNEQATKESLIKPFFTALGYDTEDPEIWRPEYCADFPGKKRSEKVDYAVLKDGAPFMLIEAKAFVTNENSLVSKDGQLARYFNATPSVKISVITNGIVYRFFTDLDRDNVQDDEPFYTFDCRTATSADLEILELFSFSKFNVKAIREWADDFKNNQRVRGFLTKLITEPNASTDFVKFILDMTYEGVKSKTVVEGLAAKLPGLMRESLDGVIRSRLGLNGNATSTAQSGQDKGQDNAIVTTVEELNVFYAIKGILTGAGKNTSVICYKDFPKWFNVSNGRAGNWFIRLYFNDSPKTILIRLPLSRCNQILGDSERIHHKPTGTVVELNESLDVSDLAAVICEAFEVCLNGKAGEHEDHENELQKSAS